MKETTVNEINTMKKKESDKSLSLKDIMNRYRVEWEKTLSRINKAETVIELDLLKTIAENQKLLFLIHEQRYIETINI